MKVNAGSLMHPMKSNVLSPRLLSAHRCYRQHQQALGLMKLQNILVLLRILALTVVICKALWMRVLSACKAQNKHVCCPVQVIWYFGSIASRMQVGQLETNILHFG
jgi:hypothetical protein